MPRSLNIFSQMGLCLLQFATESIRLGGIIIFAGIRYRASAWGAEMTFVLVSDEDAVLVAICKFEDDDGLLTRCSIKE